MANPLPDEAKIYNEIEEIVKRSHPDVKELLTKMWTLMGHHIGNDIHAMQFIAGNYIQDNPPNPIPAEDGQKLLERCESIRKFTHKLKESTKLPR
jgi:hypothetical protein